MDDVDAPRPGRVVTLESKDTMDLIKKFFAPLLVILSATIATAQDSFDPATASDGVQTAINTHLGYVVPLAIGLFGVVFLLRLVRRWMGKAGS